MPNSKAEVQADVLMWLECTPSREYLTREVVRSEYTDLQPELVDPVDVRSEPDVESKGDLAVVAVDELAEEERLRRDRHGDEVRYYRGPKFDE